MDNKVSEKNVTPHAMRWERLISSKRLGLEEYHDPESRSRSDFQRDYDRMIFSSPFRRLQNKTQVFPLPGHIFVHNRLTHSLEVSSVGRSMANSVADSLRHKYKEEEWSSLFHHLGDITATACLCHDMGNPPFGHSGEKAISTFFSEREGRGLRDMLSASEWSDFTHFEGNANSLRLLTHQFAGRRPGGFAMTYSALASIVKYPYNSLQAGPGGKFGFFTSEQDTYRKIANELGIPALDAEATRFMRHPLVFIVEAADDICYQIMDIEDAHRLAILSLDEVASLFLGFFGEEDAARMRRGMGHLDDPNEKVGYLRSNVIGALVGDCARVFAENETSLLRGELEGSLIDQASPRLREGYGRCAAIARKKIYMASDVIDVEIAGNRIITYLLNSLMEAVIHPERNFSRLLLETVPGQYDIGSDSLYTRIQGVLDHVSGMTDVYALNLFRKLNGHSLPAV